VKIEWRAVIALILALGAAITLVVLALSELDHGTAGHISEAESTLLATALGAVVGAVATYMGSTREGPVEPGATQLVNRYPAESTLRAPQSVPLYDQDQDATAEFPAAGEEPTLP
jgi:hypothetical protein